ncbi:MAG: DUF2007 domain-containing protein [Halothiobacillaceae bacterium]|nr:DUF2007 domain-containing protein [Halothiobacillaceae bacterium]HER35139.1 DUF2007 domain-containing protein [Halothiobacillaceae bacterium]
MKTIYRASDILEAHIVAGMLNAEGIEAEVAGFYQQGAVGELAPQDFARVMLIDERDMERAEQVIATYEARDPKPTEDEPGREDDGGSDSRLAGWLLVVALLLFLLGWGVL